MLQASINEQSRGEQQALLDHYPIGNVPHLDNNKRYWKQLSTGHYFELNTLRIGVWANAMVRRILYSLSHNSCIVGIGP